MIDNDTGDRQSRVWFVTGAATRFGRGLAEAILEYGDRVVATDRELERVQDLEERYPNQARLIGLNMNRTEEVRSTVAGVVTDLGSIDVLVNHVGDGDLGTIDEENDLFGILEITRAVLPHMREVGDGHIIGISSVGHSPRAGDFGDHEAIELRLQNFLEALRKEATPSGIRVSLLDSPLSHSGHTYHSGNMAPWMINDSKANQSSLEWMTYTQVDETVATSVAAEAMILAVQSASTSFRLRSRLSCLG